MRRYLDIYKDFVKQYFKILMQSKANFYIGVICFILSQISGILFLSLIFKQIPNLNGWSFYEILFIYGFAQLPRGLDHLYSDYIWIFSKSTVIKGEFDRYLLRPLNPLFQVFAERFQLDAFGELIVGFSIVGYALTHLDINITILKIISFIVVIIAGAIIYTSIKLLFAALSFWIKQSFPVLNLVYQFADFTKYPNSIYGKGIQFTLSFIIPFAFTAFIPASFFLDKESFVYGILVTCLVAFLAAIISYRVWSVGLKNYESAGN